MVRSRHTVPHRRSRRARQFGSPTGLLGGPEALIYQCLSLTSTRERGGLSAPRRNASTASAAPMRTDPLGVGVPHSHPATPFRSTQNSCSQKEVTTLLPLSLTNSASRIVGGERSHPISTLRSRRGSAHAGQYSSVCCAESTLASHWWQRAVASFPIRCRYSPKH